MDNLYPNLPPQLDSALNNYYVAPRPDPAFADQLETQLRQRYKKPNYGRNTLMQTLRSRPALAILAAILALITLSGVVYALGLLSGFIPGFGFTSGSGEVFVLTEPVESSRNGITLHLENAVSDETRFWATLTAQGLSEEILSSQAFVELPDGKELQFQEGANSSLAEDTMQFSYIFPALPAGTRTLTLRIENLAGETFSLAVKLRPVKPGEIIQAQSADAAPPQSESNNGLRLVLDNVAPASDKTVLQLSLHFDQPNTWVNGMWSIALSDEDGHFYPLEDITPETMDIGETRIYQTIPFTGTEQLTFRLNSFPPGENTLPMFQDFSADKIGFTFDPGADPQVGQTWELDETITLGNFVLHAVAARMTDPSSLVFEFDPDETVTGVMLYTPNPLLRGATGGVPMQAENFTTGMTFESIPTQPFDVYVTLVYYKTSGPWELHWQPPAAPPPPALSPTHTTAPTHAPAPTGTQASSDPLLIEVLALAQKFDAPFQQGPGWVHIIRASNTTQRAGQTFPPPYIQTEIWYEIDEEGYIRRSVYQDFDANGTLLQQSASIGSYSINFTTGDSGLYPAEPQHVSLDLLSPVLSRADPSETHIEHEQTRCENGEECLLITIQDTLAKPALNPGEEKAFIGSGWRVWINLATGLQVTEQYFWLLEDGSESISSTREVLLVEKQETAPQQILDILASVIVP